MGCGIMFPRDYRREWDDVDDAAAAAVARDGAVNGAADVDRELGAGDVGFSSSESEDEQWWERPNPDNGTKVQVASAVHNSLLPVSVVDDLSLTVFRCWLGALKIMDCIQIARLEGADSVIDACPSPQGDWGIDCALSGKSMHNMLLFH